MSIRLKVARLGLMTGSYLLTLMFGIRAELIREPMRGEFLYAITLATLVSQACLTDSRILGRSLVCTARVALFYAWPIAVPVYIVWSRGWWGFVVLAVHASLVTAVLIGWIIAAGLIAGLSELLGR